MTSFGSPVAGMNAEAGSHVSIGGVYLPVAMSLIAGTVDVTSWLTLGGLFAAHVTGNVVTVAAAVLTGKWPHLIQLLAVPLFIAGTALSWALTRSFQPRPDLMLRRLLLAQLALLICANIVAVISVAMSQAWRWSELLVGTSALLAMSAQNATLHLILKPSPTTAVMTGNLVSATLGLTTLLFGSPEEKVTGRRQWRSAWPLLAGFFVGCLIGATAVSQVHAWAWALPAVFALVLVVAEQRNGPQRRYAFEG